MAHEALKKLCEKHAGVKVRKQGSFDAGNCESGTKDFIELYFPHRRVVRIKELVPYIDSHRHVRALLIYKLRGLEGHEVYDEDEHPF